MERGPIQPRIEQGREIVNAVGHRLAEKATVFSHNVIDRAPRIGLKPSRKAERQHHADLYDRVAPHLKTIPPEIVNVVLGYEQKPPKIL